MKKPYNDISTERKKYEAPEIMVVKLDTAISLEMASDPDPFGEPEWPEYSQNSIAPDPWRSNLG
ncbi:MAG: hypothetical protein EOM47_13810 [Bacteroidia bacterium]|nr:hypothetical protein [Bacteroidia bacterium]